MATEIFLIDSYSLILFNILKKLKILLFQGKKGPKSRILFVDDDKDLSLVAKEFLNPEEPVIEFVTTTSTLEVC